MVKRNLFNEICEGFEYLKKARLKIQTDKLHDDWLLAKLQDYEFASVFLEAASQDNDPKAYLSATRKALEVRDNIAAANKKTLDELMKDKSVITGKEVAQRIKEQEKRQ